MWNANDDMIGVYAGRFQPFHLGHLSAIKHITSICDETYVLICSKKGDSPTDDRNPFSYEEREQMIKRSMGLPQLVHYRHVCDQDNDQEWTRVIEGTLPKGRIISFSNNPHTTTAFKAHGYETRSLPIVYDNISATIIRKHIIRNEPWKHLVPAGTFDTITEIQTII